MDQKARNRVANCILIACALSFQRHVTAMAGQLMEKVTVLRI